MISSTTFLILTISMVHVTYAKNIKINIDSDDLLNLIKIVMSSDMFKNVAAKMVQKRAVQTMYNNPYHPEDDVVEIHMKTENEHLKPDAKRDNTLKNSPVVLEAYLEKENDNFIALKEDKSEDVLTENDQVGTEKAQTTTTSKTLKNKVSSPPKEKYAYEKTIKSDKHNFKPLQRRYVLKGSFK
ncbi:hypothetical protein O3G_MSEX001732 [Manduca sexta]|uniref:Uncharacterized protein n=1 Tax=Manduca sexta TaxID=7130 RepID=A0A921YKY1_MANSE|nr:hypothetical protein O3G_MSEX001732 [Manduca sexta]